MLVNVLRLPERSMPLGGESGGNPSLSADAETFCQCVLSVCLPVVSSLLCRVFKKVSDFFLLFPVWMFPSK
jgi:hypothetical protein